MSEIRTIPPQLTRDQWNALLDHALEKPASYIIRNSNGTIQAINGSTGKIDYSGADASTVIQSAINALTNGSIFIKKGNYELNNRIIVYNKSINIIGEKGARLYAGSSMVDNLIVLNVANFSSVQGLELDGVKASHSYNNDPDKQHGIYVLSCNHVTIRDNYVHDVVGAGIFLYNGLDITIDNNRVMNNGISTCPSRGGIYSYYANNVCITRNYLYNSYRINICLSGKSTQHATYFLVDNNILDGTVDSGSDANLLAYLADYGIISNNIILNGHTTGTDADGIRVELGTNWVIKSNIVKNNVFGMYVYGAGTEQIIITGNEVVGNTNYGILIQDVDYVTVENNIIKDNTNLGLAICDYCNVVSVIGNQFINNTGGAFHAVATNLTVTHNQGYVTENSGTATFSGNGTQTQFTIAHGLAGTPKSYRVEAGSADAKGDKYVTADATNLTVTFATAPPTGTNNVVLVWSAEM
jgi:parallel beta-helix repeat protein